MQRAAPRVRLAGLSDLETLENLERRCFEPPRHQPWDRRQLTAELAEEVKPQRLFLVAESDLETGAHLVGYALFQIAHDEAELLRMASLPEKRRRGVGRQLLADGLTRLDAAGIRCCHLEVRADNEPALALYRSFAFSSVGRRSGYYRDGGDAVLMRADLARAELLPNTSSNPSEDQPKSPRARLIGRASGC